MNMNANRRNGGMGRDMNRGNMRYTAMGHSEAVRQAPWLRFDNSGQQGSGNGTNSGNSNGGCCGCNNGCGCSTDTMSCKHLLEKIRMLDFSICEVVLYLDAYPDSCEALAMYHQLIAERQEVLSLYEAACGPLTAGGNQSHTSWDWFKGPFPWDYEAN